MFSRDESLDAADGALQSAANVDEKKVSPDPKLLSGKTSSGFFVRPLKQLAEIQLCNRLGSIASVREYINANPLLKKLLQPTLMELEIKLAFLLRRIAHGDYARVKEFLETNQEYLPCLLKSVGVATASSGQKMESTPLGMALCTEDVDYVDELGRKTIEGIAELIMQHLRELPKSNAEPSADTVIAEQIAALFPEEWEKEEAARHERNLAALAAVRTAINDSKEDAGCEAALQSFSDYIDNSRTGIIKTGLQWDAGFLLAALDLGYNQYNDFDSRKNELYYVKVVGYIQRLAPDNYAQALAQGLYYILHNGEKLKRCLDFRYGGGSYYPLAAGSVGLGHNYWYEAARGVVGCVGWLRTAGGGPRPRLFKTLCKQKQHRGENYCAEARATIKVLVHGDVAGDLSPAAK